MIRIANQFFSCSQPAEKKQNICQVYKIRPWRDMSWVNWNGGAMSWVPDWRSGFSEVILPGGFSLIAWECFAGKSTNKFGWNTKSHQFCEHFVFYFSTEKRDVPFLGPSFFFESEAGAELDWSLLLPNLAAFLAPPAATLRRSSAAERFLAEKLPRACGSCFGRKNTWMVLNEKNIHENHQVNQFLELLLDIFPQLFGLRSCHTWIGHCWSKGWRSWEDLGFEGSPKEWLKYWKLMWDLMVFQLFWDDQVGNLQIFWSEAAMRRSTLLIRFPPQVSYGVSEYLGTLVCPIHSMYMHVLSCTHTPPFNVCNACVHSVIHSLVRSFIHPSKLTTYEPSWNTLFRVHPAMNDFITYESCEGRYCWIKRAKTARFHNHFKTSKRITKWGEFPTPKFYHFLPTMSVKKQIVKSRWGRTLVRRLLRFVGSLGEPLHRFEKHTCFFLRDDPLLILVWDGWSAHQPDVLQIFIF